MDKYIKDFIDVEYVAPLVINEDYIMSGNHNGSVQIESGTFTLYGTLKGTLHVQSGAKAKIIGRQQGTVMIDSNSLVIVEGSIEGTTTLQPKSSLIVEKGGRVAGQLKNNGQFILKGVFGGNSTGQGEFIIEDSGYIKKPTIKNGFTYYEW